jgi:hypothetical protein
LKGEPIEQGEWGRGAFFYFVWGILFKKRLTFGDSLEDWVSIFSGVFSLGVEVGLEAFENICGGRVLVIVLWGDHAENLRDSPSINPLLTNHLLISIFRLETIGEPFSEH